MQERPQSRHLSQLQQKCVTWQARLAASTVFLGGLACLLSRLGLAIRLEPPQGQEFMPGKDCTCGVQWPCLSVFRCFVPASIEPSWHARYRSPVLGKPCQRISGRRADKSKFTMVCLTRDTFAPRGSCSGVEFQAKLPGLLQP